MKKNSLNIFNKYTNNNYKIVPYKEKGSDMGNTRYFPPVSREWKNSIYIFNLNNLKNLPIYDIKINNLIKMFFNLRKCYCGSGWEGKKHQET